MKSEYSEVVPYGCGENHGTVGQDKKSGKLKTEVESFLIKTEMRARWDSGTWDTKVKSEKMRRKIQLKAINSEIYMKNDRSFRFTVYCFLKWNDFSLQVHYLKHLSRPTFDGKGLRSETTGHETWQGARGWLRLKRTYETVRNIS